ncbi:putative protein DUf3079 [Aromatoleum bremense]|nr:putative protein DUf3079 [Aromatoleum bremense]
MPPFLTSLKYLSAWPSILLTTSRPARPVTPRMAKKFPLHPKHPERICWGCDKYCPTDSLACGNGSGRTMHPAEMLGDDWYTYGDWDLEPAEEAKKPEDSSS